MKTKTKTLAVVEIAIVLCSMLLVATLPAITTASEDEFTLGIYGNANEDDIIDMRDTTYIKLAIFGKKSKTDLADANYDGKISMLDVGQTKLIILGTEKKLTLIDSADRIVTVKKPVKTTFPMYGSHVAITRAIGARDKVIGVVDSVKNAKTFYPELSKLPFINLGDPDFEVIFELNPDILTQNTYRRKRYNLEEKLEPTDITLVCLNLNKAEHMAEEVVKLGYILDTKEEAKEYLNFYEGYLDTIAERVEGLSEEDKPRLFLGGHSYPPSYRRWYAPMIPLAGGRDICADLPGDDVDPEWLIAQNPNIIFTTDYLSNAGYDVDDPSEMKVLRDELYMNRLGFQSIDAVKKGKVYSFHTDIYDRAYFVGQAYMAKACHPELFEDLDPQAIHQEYLTKFCGLDYDLDEHGVFIYPPYEEWQV